MCFVLFFPFQLALFILTALFDRKRKLTHYNSSIWCYFALALSPLWRVDLQGKENLDRTKPHVVIMNHQSLIDVLITFRLFYPFKMIGKKALAFVPIVGWNLFLSGHLFVDRKNMKSQFRAIRKLESLIADGESIFVYPEGTRTKDGDIGEFKKGAFRSATSTGTSVIPVVIDGPFQILPKKGFILSKKQNIIIRVLPAIPVEKGEDPGQLALKCHEVMSGELEKIRNGI